MVKTPILGVRQSLYRSLYKTTLVAGCHYLLDVVIFVDAPHHPVAVTEFHCFSI